MGENVSSGWTEDSKLCPESNTSRSKYETAFDIFLAADADQLRIYCSSQHKVDTDQATHLALDQKHNFPLHLMTNQGYTALNTIQT